MSDRQERGVAWDIIDEAMTTYCEWMKDDNYDAMAVLHSIMGRMKPRSSSYRGG